MNKMKKEFRIFQENSSFKQVRKLFIILIDDNVVVQIFLVGISIITAIIIWKKMSESNKLVKNSNELLKKDIDSRIRPWVMAGETKPNQVIFEDDSVQYYDVWAKDPSKFPFDVKEVLVRMELINSGSMPAKKFRKKIASSHSILDKNSFADIRFDELSVKLMSNQKHFVNWHIPWADWKNRPSNPLYLGILFEYEVEENKTEESGLIVNMGHAGTHVIKSW